MNTTIEVFYDLDTWKKAHSLTLAIYKLTNHFPKTERFGLTSQIRRAVCSIETNIAEGFGRYYYKDKQRFYYYARGSLSETQSLLILARDLSLIPNKKYSQIFVHTETVARLIFGLTKSLQKQNQ